MLVRFSKETAVCNLLKGFLSVSNANVIQFVYPGQQSLYCLKFKDIESEKDRIVYPDLIALINDVIYIGEIKPTFSAVDANKLNNIRCSVDGALAIRKLVSRIIKTNAYDKQIIYCLIHSGKKVLPVSHLHQIVLYEDSVVIILPSESS